ncbi:MAG: hypothetical protein WC683_10195 [bacterium]
MARDDAIGRQRRLAGESALRLSLKFAADYLRWLMWPEAEQLRLRARYAHDAPLRAYAISQAVKVVSSAARRWGQAIPDSVAAASAGDIGLLAEHGIEVSKFFQEGETDD